LNSKASFEAVARWDDIEYTKALHVQGDYILPMYGLSYIVTQYPTVSAIYAYMHGA